MRIGELAKQAIVSRDTIRLYERMGLLTDVSQPHEWNNYKEYGTGNLRRVALIKLLKQLGFTLKECREVLTLIDNNAVDEATRRAHVEQKVVEIDAKIAELNRTKELLMQFVETPFCDHPADCLVVTTLQQATPEA